MKNYKFLLKPLFFICSLLFATWLVIKIEKISPSDFGKYKSLFESEVKQAPVPDPIIEKRKLLFESKSALKKMYSQYKSGIIDSITFDKQLEAQLKKLSDKASVK